MSKLTMTDYEIIDDAFDYLISNGLSDKAELYDTVLTKLLRHIHGGDVATDEFIEKSEKWFSEHWREYIDVDADGEIAFHFWKNDYEKAMRKQCH